MPKKLAGKKIAILLCDGFEEVEMTKPRQALIKAGAEVDLITPKGSHVKACKHGTWTKKYKVDMELKKASPENYDLVLLPGGVMNPDELRTHKNAIDFIKKFFKKNKYIAAICHGPWPLIETKKIKGMNLTSYHSIKTDLKNAGALWKDKAVVVDGGLITSRTPSDIPTFVKTIINKLAN